MCVWSPYERIAVASKQRVPVEHQSIDQQKPLATARRRQQGRCRRWRLMLLCQIDQNRVAVVEREAIELQCGHGVLRRDLERDTRIYCIFMLSIWSNLQKATYRHVLLRKLFPLEEVDLHEIHIIVDVQLVQQHQAAAHRWTSVVNIQSGFHAGECGFIERAVLAAIEQRLCESDRNIRL